MNLALWWHNVTHKHATVKKDGLAEIDFCSSRWPWRKGVARVITFDDSTYEPALVPPMGLEDWKRVFQTQTATEMRRVVVALREGRNA